MAGVAGRCPSSGTARASSKFLTPHLFTALFKQPPLHPHYHISSQQNLRAKQRSFDFRGFLPYFTSPSSILCVETQPVARMPVAHSVFTSQVCYCYYVLHCSLCAGRHRRLEHISCHAMPCLEKCFANFLLLGLYFRYDLALSLAYLLTHAYNNRPSVEGISKLKFSSPDEFYYQHALSTCKTPGLWTGTSHIG